MTSMPAVKITRAGIEVNEVPTDLSVLEGRMDAVEAKNQEQDATLGVNGGNISVLQGDVATNTARLGDLAAVETAVAALQALSHSEVSLDSVNAAITALQDASVSNAATIAAVNTALTDLESGKVANAETAIAALQALNPGAVSVTTLATKAQVDTKQNRVTSISQGFKDFGAALIDNAVRTGGPLNLKRQSFQDWLTESGGDPFDNPDNHPGIYTGYYLGDERHSYNMKLFMQKGDEEFWAGKGPRNPDVPVEVTKDDDVSLPPTPPIGLLWAKMIDRLWANPDVSFDQLYPEYANTNPLVAVRSLTPMEVNFLETRAAADANTADLVEFTDAHKSILPVTLKPGEKLKKIDLYTLRDDVDELLPRALYGQDSNTGGSTGTGNRNTASNPRKVYANLFETSTEYKWVILRPASKLYVGDAMSHCTGFCGYTADVHSLSYQARSHYEMSKLKPLLEAKKVELMNPSAIYNTAVKETLALKTGGGIGEYTSLYPTSVTLDPLELVSNNTGVYASINTNEDAIKYLLAESLPDYQFFITYHMRTPEEQTDSWDWGYQKTYSNAFADAVSYAITGGFDGVFSSSVDAIQAADSNVTNEEASKQLLSGLYEDLDLGKIIENKAFRDANEQFSGGYLNFTTDSIKTLMANTSLSITTIDAAKEYLLRSVYDDNSAWGFQETIAYHLDSTNWGGYQKTYSEAFDHALTYTVTGAADFANAVATVTIAELQASSNVTLSDEEAGRQVLASLKPQIDALVTTIVPAMDADVAEQRAVEYWANFRHNERIEQWSFDHHRLSTEETAGSSSALTKAYLDKFKDKDLILCVDHGRLQFDYSDYMVCGMLEQVYNKYHGNALVVNSDYSIDYSTGYKNFFDILRDEVFVPIGCPDIKFGWPRSNVEAAAISSYGTPFNVFRERYSESEDRSQAYALIFNAYVQTDQKIARHLDYEVRCKLSDYAKMMRVITRGGMLADGTRFANSESIERLLHPLMLEEDLDVTVHLRGDSDDCFGARWRNMTPLGGVARGPHMEPFMYRRRDLLTKFVNENGRFPIDTRAGEAEVWDVSRPPSRCIVLRNNPNSSVFAYYFPDLDMFAALCSNDGIIASAKEFGAAQIAFSNEASITLNNIANATVQNAFINPEYPAALPYTNPAATHDQYGNPLPTE